MKQSASPAVIAGAVVALLVVVFLIYHFTFGGNSQSASGVDTRPDYVKKLQAGQNPGNPFGGGSQPANANQGGSGH